MSSNLEEKQEKKKKGFKDSRVGSMKGLSFFTGKYREDVDEARNVSMKTELEERLEAAEMSGGKRELVLSPHKLSGAHEVDEGGFMGRHTTEWKERLRKYAHERHAEKKLKEGEEQVKEGEEKGKFAALIKRIKSEMRGGRSLMGISMGGATQLKGSKRYSSIKYIRHRALK